MTPEQKELGEAIYGKEDKEAVEKVSQVKQFLDQLGYNLDLAHSELNTLETMLVDVLRDEKGNEEVAEHIALVPLADVLRAYNETVVYLVKKIQSMQKRQELL